MHLCSCASPHVPAPCLPISMPFSTSSWFPDCYTSQLVFCSPTSCLRTRSPDVCPPTSPKASFFPQQPHTTQPREAVRPLSLRAKEHGANSSFLSLLFFTHTHTHTHTHTPREMDSQSFCFCFPSSFDTLFIWILLPNELFGSDVRARDWMSPFYVNGKSTH